jgi:hypothetical protein
MGEIHYDDRVELVEGLARVVEIKGDVAWLEPEQTTTCGGCAASGACGAKDMGTVASRVATRRFPLIDHPGLQVGERILVGVPGDPLRWRWPRAVGLRTRRDNPGWEPRRTGSRTPPGTPRRLPPSCLWRECAALPAPGGARFVKQAPGNSRSSSTLFAFVPVLGHMQPGDADPCGAARAADIRGGVAAVRESARPRRGARLQGGAAARLAKPSSDPVHVPIAGRLGAPEDLEQVLAVAPADAVRELGHLGAESSQH